MGPVEVRRFGADLMAGSRAALPAIGDVLAIALDDGAWGAAWVARRGRPAPSTAHLGPHVVIAGTTWFGTRRPTLAELRPLRVLQIDHDGYDLPALWNVNEPAPASVVSIGHLDRAPRVGVAPWISGWARIAYIANRQRLWNVDRAASASAYAQQRVAWARDHVAAAAAREVEEAARRHTTTLAALRREPVLTAWRGAMSRARLAEARALIVDAIIRIEADPRPKARLAALRACVTAFNRWNGVHGLIETAEREALHEALRAIAFAAGLGERGDELDRWRDW